MPWEIPITLEDTTYPVRFNTEAEPTQADIDEAVAYLMQQRSAPAAAPTDQPGRLGSFASSVGRGALSIIPGTIGGVGYLTGSDTLTEAADTVEGGINRMLPVNPEYQGEFKMKAGQAIGQALSMLGTGGVAGAAGKGLAISRGLEKAAAAAKGVKAAQNVMLGTGVLQGTRGGGQAAEQYGMQGGTAYARALLGGAIEGATERYLFGMGSELSPIGRMLGTGGTPAGAGLLRAVGTEAGEEAVAQVGGNLATTALAPYGIETPGAFAGAGEAALLGGIAGGVFGGVNALMQPSPTIEGEAMVPFEQAPAASETEAQDELGVAAFQQEIAQIAQEPDPIVPLQQTVNKAAETSVAANVELLPATAAVIAAGGLTPAPAVEEPATPAASTPEGEYFHGSSADFDTFSTVRSITTPQGRKEEKVPITKDGRGQIYLTKDADYAATYGAKVKSFKPRSDLNLASFEELGHKDVTASDINSLLSKWGVNHAVKGDARPVFEWLKYGTLKQPLVSAGYDGFKLLESRSDSGRAVETIALFDNASIAERKGTPVGAPVVEQPASGVLLPETTPAPANFNEYELQQIEQANRDAALKALESNSQTAAITVDGNGVTLQMGDRQRHPTQNTSLTATVTDGELTADERKEAKRISQEGSLAETPEERAENKADQRALVRRVFERVYGTVAEQPVVEVPETLDQIRARLRQRISAEERATMEQNLAQMEDEGILADVFAEERQRAAQREDAARRQQDIENERQRFEDQGILGDVFAEERQRATAREQQRQQPPVVEETVAPEQPVPAVEETVAAQTDPATEEAPDRLMDVPQAMQFLYGKGLTKTDREKAQKLIEKNEREARKTGKVSGGRAFYESEIDAAVEEVLAQKQTSSDFRRTLEKARANKEASQELSTLVDALDVAEATLKEIESDRGMFGVQWAEKNVRRRATMQKAKIRDLKERIVALAPVKKSKTNAKPLLSRSERRAPEEPTKAEYEALLEEDRVNQLKAFKEERASLIDLYGNRGEKHPSGRQLGALNPAAQRLAYVRSRIFELEAKNPKEKAEKPEMTPVPGVNPKGKEGLLYNVKFGSRKGQIGKAGGKWYVVEDGDIVTENHPTAVAARDLWAKIGEAPPVKKSKTDAKPLLSRSERRALEEAEKAASTPETVPNVEITVDEPGAAEVGLGMEKLTSDFDTLFPLPAKQPRTLTAMRDRVITKMDELESTPDLPIYGSISSEEKDLNFKKNELRDAQLKKLNFILEKIEAEKLMQSKGHAPFARPAKRKPATPWSQDRPTVEEAKAYLTEKFGPEADSKYGDGWDSVRADVNNGIPRNRAIVNAAIEEKQLEADNKAADEKQAKEIAEQEPDSVLPSQPAYKPATTPSVAPKSPMMKQWEAIKTSVGDALVAVRLGDFYEFFYQDAEAAAPILNVALTKRNDLPMAGIPHHAAEKYFKQLVAAGRKVAVVDMSDLGKMKESLASRLRAATSRAEAESLLDSAKLDEVKAAALEMNYPAKGSKKDISRALISSVGSRVDAIAIRGAGITPVKPEPTVAPTPGAGTLSSGQRDTSKPEQMTPEESYAAYTTAKNLAPNLADMPKTQKQIQEGIAIAENSGIKDSELQRMLMDSAKAETGQFAGPYIKAQRIRLIEEAMEAQKSVSKAAVDAYKITLPEGYVQDGELYVYHPRLAYLKSREVDAYGGTALSDAEDAELAELQGQIAPEPAPPVQRDVTKPEQMTPEELYRDIANAQIATLESEIAAIKKSKNNPKSPWYGAKASETDKRQREIDQLKAPVMADWGIVIRALDAKLANREPVTEAWDELLKLLRLPGEFKARVEKAGYVRQGDLYVFQPSGTVEAVSETVPPAKKTPESLLSALGGGWKLDGTTVSKDGFGHWTEKQRDEVRAVFKKAGILTNTATPSGSGNRKSSFTIPSDDARRIQDEVFAEEVKLREAKKEQAKADEAAKQAEELSRVDPAAKQWMDSLFGRDDFANPANKVHLSDFVTGKTAKFGGMVNPRWLDGVQAADAVLEGGKVDFQKLKENFESSVAKPAPQPKPAAEVETPAPKKPRASQEYVDAVLPTVNAMLDGSDASTVITAAAGKKLPRKDEVRVVIEWVQQRREEGGMALPSDFAGLQMEQAYMLEPVLKALGLQPAAEVETPVAGVPAEVDAFFNPPPLSETVPLPRSEKIKIGPAAQQGFKARVKIAADEVSQIRSGYDGVGRLMEVALERGGVDEAIAFREWLLRQKDLSPEARRALLDFALPREQADWLKPKDFGSTNTVVTKETKDQAVKSLRKKIGGQTNVGLDPSILKDAIAIGAFYLEGGVRNFAEFSAKMIEEFGAGVQKYIRPAYEALRKRTDIDTSGMDPEEGGETAPKAQEPKTPPPPAPKAAPTPAAAKAAPTPAAAKVEPATVPIANDPVDAQRVALGLPPIMRQTQEAYTFPQMWADAEAAMKADPNVGKTLVESLNKKPRTISALEDAILLRERVNRVNTLDLSMVEFNNAPKGNNETQRDNMDTAITELTKLDDALNVAGTEQGRSLNARKMLARQDYTLAKMITALRAANDGNLSESDVAMVTRLQKQIAEAQAKLAEVESGQAARVAEAEKVAFEAGRQEVLKDIQDRAKADAAKIAEMQKRTADVQAAKKEAAKKPSVLDDWIKAAEARKAARRGKLYNDVLMLNAAADAADTVFIGALKIAKGITKFADWALSMKESDPELPEDQMEQLFKESQAMHDGEAPAAAAETPLKTRKAKAPAIDKVKAIAADEESLDSRTVYELVVEKMKARAEASQGAKLPEMSEADLTSVIREVTADVQQYFPDITEREVRDLFSGYGKILQPSQDELSKQIRQLSALGKLASAIEDAKAKIAPLKSGPQRDKATQAIRLQQKKLARELRMSGLEYAAGEGQLRSPLDAIKARLNNQINDLALEINQRQKIKKRPSVDYDRETEALVTLRDDLKRISDEVNKPAGPTLEETVAEEMKKIDKRILELQKLIAENKFKPKEDTLLHTAELDAKRDVRDGLNKTLAKLRKEAADKLRTQDDIDKDAIESAQESIAELEKKIAAKDVSRPQRRTPTETAEYQALIEKKKSLQQVLSKLRESIEGKRQMSGEQRIKAATKALDASIARMTGMITSGKFDVIKRTPKTPDTPELKAKREARNNLRKRILELRKMKRDAGIDPIAKQISTDKKRIQTRMRKLKERMDKGDFSKPVKKTRATDEELLKLQIEEEELKEKWAKTVFERQLASRGPGKRLLDATQQTLNTSRAILTSVDVSAVLRQGGFIVLGNPMRGFRNLAPMFKAFASDEFAKGEKFRLANRENYKNGLYQQSKLFLADTSRIDQMSKQEEAFMTRWLEKIPRALGGGILRGSQRAYTVFLNRLRADSFDAMVGNLKKGAEPTPEETKAVADYINIATGRGDLGKFNQAGTMLNTVFFAPRLVASRFQILAGYPYFTASGRTKALVLREYAKFLAGAAVVYALGSLAQDDDDEPIETDPRSSDFLKIRFGDTRVDPLSGLIQATVLLSRLASGEKKQASGKIVPIRGADVPYGADDSFDVMGNFVRTKFSPIVGSAVNVVTGKNVVGEPTDVTEELKRMVIPMSLMEMKETLEAQGVPEATALIMLQLFGMGVQTYTPGKK